MVSLMSRVVTIGNRKSSMRLSNVEWHILEQICLQEKTKRKNLLEMIEAKRPLGFGQTAGVRLFILIYLYTNPNRQTSDTAHLQNTLDMLI